MPRIGKPISDRRRQQRMDRHAPIRREEEGPRDDGMAGIVSVSSSRRGIEPTEQCDGNDGGKEGGKEDGVMRRRIKCRLDPTRMEDGASREVLDVVAETVVTIDVPGGIIEMGENQPQREDQRGGRRPGNVSGTAWRPRSLRGESGSRRGGAGKEAVR
mmetsp:Transcript_29679/g.56552  ORF Transcript_29679/g.56552 Transcript_29679/m.56552 type:complete len:158 (-) Transcript_29679:235-708(-)